MAFEEVVAVQPTAEETGDEMEGERISSFLTLFFPMERSSTEVMLGYCRGNMSD
jgi:hypothetical protein